MNTVSKCIFPTSVRYSKGEQTSLIRKELPDLQLCNEPGKTSRSFLSLSAQSGSKMSAISVRFWQLTSLRPTQSLWYRRTSVTGMRSRAEVFRESVLTYSLSYRRGTRFSYTFYYPTPLPCENPTRLSKAGSQPKTLRTHPIHASITALDHEAMDILAIDNASKSAGSVHDAFAAYLSRTKNTICGRHPIGVLIGALAALESAGAAVGERPQTTLRWVKYAQSSACVDIRDSSVSYASAYVTIA